MEPRLVAQLRTLAAASDEEVCGALVGECALITEIWPLPNRSEEPERSFLIPAADVLLTELHAQRRGLEILGFYHSHARGSATPSPADLAQALPGYIYAIVTRAGDVRSWRLRSQRDGFDEVT